MGEISKALRTVSELDDLDLPTLTTFDEAIEGEDVVLSLQGGGSRPHTTAFADLDQALWVVWHHVLLRCMEDESISKELVRTFVSAATEFDEYGLLVQLSHRRRPYRRRRSRARTDRRR